MMKSVPLPLSSIDRNLRFMIDTPPMICRRSYRRNGELETKTSSIIGIEVATVDRLDEQQLCRSVKENAVEAQYKHRI
jgi:hypothetical protein